MLLKTTRSIPHRLLSPNSERLFKGQEKKIQKAQACSKKMLFNQIKMTNSSLRIKRFQRTYNPNRICNTSLDNRQRIKLVGISNQQSNEIRNKLRIRSFSNFLKNKKVQNVYLKNKMKLFGSILSERNKANLEKSINEQILKQNRISNTDELRKSEIKSNNNTTAEKDQLDDTKKYTICHMILENFLQLLTNNVSNISLKQQNREIYKNIKEEMVSIIIKDKKKVQIFQQLLKNHQNNIVNENMSTNKRIFQISKLNELRKKRKPYYFMNQNKKDELQMQIQSILNKFEKIILHAFEDAGIAYTK